MPLHEKADQNDECEPAHAAEYMVAPVRKVQKEDKFSFEKYRQQRGGDVIRQIDAAAKPYSTGQGMAQAHQRYQAVTKHCRHTSKPDPSKMATPEITMSGGVSDKTGLIA